MKPFFFETKALNTPNALAESELALLKTVGAFSGYYRPLEMLLGSKDMRRTITHMILINSALRRFVLTIPNGGGE